VTLIRELRRLEQAVERVVSQIALRAADGLADQADCLELEQQVLRGFVDMEHAVHRLARRALPRRHDRHVLRSEREVVGDADAGDARSEQRLVGDAFHRVSVHEDPRPVGAKGFPEVGTRHQHGARPTCFNN
jgi:hypothetical protein